MRGISRRAGAVLALAAVVVALLGGAGCSQTPEARKQKALERAQGYLKDGKPNEAIIELRNALQIDKDFVPALQGLGRAYGAKGWWADAARELGRAQALAPDDLLVTAELGRAFLELGLAREAGEQAERLLSRDARSPSGLALKAGTLVLQAKPDEALGVLAEARKGGVTLPPEAESIRADALARQGKLAEAEQAYRAALKVNATDVRSLTGLGLMSLRQNKTAEALDALTEARRLRPNDSRVRLGLASARRQQGKLEDAIRELEEVELRARTPSVSLTLASFYLQANRPTLASALLSPLVQRAPKWTQARYLLGMAYLAADRGEEALAEFQELQKQVPDDALVRFRVAQALVQRGRATEALAVLAALQKPLEKTPDYHLERGRALLLLGKGDEALRAAAEAQRLAPQSPRPYLLMGQAQAMAGNTRAARDMFLRAAETEGGAAPAHLALGRLAVAEKDIAGALREFDLAAEAAPGSYGVARTKVLALVQQNRLKDAIAFAEAAVKGEGAKDARFHALLGALLSRDRQWERAEAAYKKALGMEARSVEARLGLARVALARQREDDAVGHLREVLQVAPAQPAAVLLLAGLYDKRAQYDQAVPILERAVAAEPRQTSFALSLADIYLKKGRYDDVVARAGDLLKQAPDLHAARLLRAQALLAKGDGTGALKDVAEVARANPKSEAAHFLLGRAYRALGRVQDAQAAYREALRLKPDFAPAKVELAALTGDRAGEAARERLERLQEASRKDPKNAALREEVGRLLLAAGKTKEGQAELRAVLEQAPGRAAANFLLAMSLLRENRADEAVPHLQAVLRTNSSHVEANLVMGGYLARRGQREEAIRHFETALRVNPNLPGTRFDLGLLYAQVGRFPDALRAAQEVEKAAPKHPAPPTLRGMVLLGQGKLREALEAFERALKIQGDFFEAQRGRAQALEALGQVDRAIEEYRKALGLRKDDVIALNNLAWLLAEVRKKPEEALPLATRARELAPNTPEVLDTLGWVHYRRGAYAEAEKLLAVAAERNPRHAAIQYHLGLTYSRLGKKNDAVFALRRAAQLDPALARAEKLDQLIKELGG